MSNSASHCDTLKIASFNCKSLKRSINAVEDLCTKNDIVLLQETWLTKQDLHLLKSVNQNFNGEGISNVDLCNGPLLGRPYGGLAILWKKSLDLSCSFLRYDDDCVIGLEIDYNRNGNLLLLNCYLPYECHENTEHFYQCLGNIASIINTSKCIHVIAAGDFNADCSSLLAMNERPRQSRFGKIFRNFCEDENLVMCDIIHLQKEGGVHTFLSEAHNSVSWIDHCIATASAAGLIRDICINNKYLSSDHLPMCLTLNYSHVKLTIKKHNHPSPTVNWKSLQNSDINQYLINTENLLNNVKIPAVIHCHNPNCVNQGHYQDISTMYRNITKCLQLAGEQFMKQRSTNKYHIPGWNSVCKDAHDNYRDAYHMWINNNKPKFGILFDLYRKSRAHFKYTLRICKQDKERHIADSIASDLSSKNYTKFWKKVKSKNKCCNSTAASINGVSGTENIAHMWKNHYSNLLNSCPPTQETKSQIDMLTSTDHVFHKDMIVTTGEIERAIKDLKSGKSPGHDNLSSEHFKYATHKLVVLLSLCITCMFTHNFIPDDCIKTIMSPLVKDGAGNIADANNYRPISLTTIISKLIELVILNRYEHILISVDNQFGFKKNLSTDMCIFSMKQIVHYYISKSSPVYACFLDASKAFDRVNHYKLFSKMIKCGIPIFVVKLIMYWYSQQSFCVKWDNVYSDSFNVSNGVRQGGILSPYLFNLYTNGLCYELSNCNAGCNFNGQMINNIAYADDMTLLSPSPKGLQKLLDICTEYGMRHDIIFNAKKSVCMCLTGKTLKIERTPFLNLNGKALQFVEKVKYLGVIVTNDCCDNSDIARQLSGMYCRSNMLIRNFTLCSTDIKIKLFQSFCCNLYCAQLWYNVNKTRITKMRTAYNKGLRRFLQYKLDSFEYSASEMFVTNNVDPFDVLIRKSLHSFYTRLMNCDNCIIQCLSDSMQFYDSPFLKQYLISVYNFS